MRLWIDEYAGLESPIHRWDPRQKLIALVALIFAFSFVRDLRLVPLMALITAGLYALARLPVSFLVTRLRYPGYFMLIMAVILPFFAGETVIVQAGPLALREEGLREFALIAGRFACILTVGLVLFGTAPFLAMVKAMRSLGLPAILADMTLLAFRYVYEIGDTLVRMETAMRLRGFRARRFSLGGLATLAALAGSLLVRSFEQSERVYNAMRLRGYGRNGKTDDPAFSDTGESAAEGGPLLRVEGLSFSYPDQPRVLRDVSFEIAPGERVGLVGPNGAGKTSLFLLIGGVLKPEAGTITLAGQPLHSGTFHPAIGLVFQNPDDQLFSPSVRDDVAFGPQNMGLPEEVVARRVAAALATVGASELADRPPHHLSGGEKRMVAIAGVLAMHPQLVIYDEPDANLDVRARRRLIRFLQASEQTLLIASHDLELVLEVCDRVLVLDEARIVAAGPPAAILADTALMEAHGLERPHSLIPHEHLNGTPAHAR
jgi:cobalt/nickel transport system ATP-binding protein